MCTRGKRCALCGDVVIWVVEAMADPRGDGDMPSMDKATKDTTGVRTDLDAALDPAERAFIHSETARATYGI